MKLLEKQNDYKSKASEPVPYDGIRDAIIIDSWIRAVERFADLQVWDDNKTCRFASTLFRGRADAWYRTIEINEEPVTSWLELKRRLIEFFRPDNAVIVARDKLTVLRQTTDLVTYVSQFMDLKLALPGMNNEESTDRFIRGLTSRPMRAHIRQNNCDNLQEAIRSALFFDSANKEEVFSSAPVRRPVQQRYVDDPMDLDAIDDTADDIYAINNFVNGRQHNNRRFNNNSYNNRNANSNSYRRNNNNNNHNPNIVCFYCNKKGHIKSLCSTRRADIRALDDNRQRQSRNKDFQ